MRKKLEVTCDVSNKTWLNMSEAITYMSFGNEHFFRDKMASGELPFYMPNGRVRVFKRTDLDRLIEKSKFIPCQIKTTK